VIQRHGWNLLFHECLSEQLQNGGCVSALATRKDRSAVSSFFFGLTPRPGSSSLPGSTMKIHCDLRAARVTRTRCFSACLNGAIRPMIHPRMPSFPGRLWEMSAMSDTADFFRSRLDHMIELRHALAL